MDRKCFRADSSCFGAVRAVWCCHSALCWLYVNVLIELSVYARVPSIKVDSIVLFCSSHRALPSQHVFGWTLSLVVHICSPSSATIILTYVWPDSGSHVASAVSYFQACGPSERVVSLGGRPLCESSRHCVWCFCCAAGRRIGDWSQGKTVWPSRRCECRIFEILQLETY